jgi:hypothetical protein
MPIRHVVPEDIPYLQQRMKQLGSEFIDLNRTPAWVSTDDSGNIQGVLAARLTWQLQPLLIFPEVENRMTRRRSSLGLYRAAEAWISNRLLNTTGIHWFFAVTRSEGVISWAKKLGWFQQYIGTTFFIKHL